MKDKVGAQDKISFVLNGKPIESKPALICTKCGADRLRTTCPLSINLPRMLQECPMVATAQ